MPLPVGVQSRAGWGCEQPELAVDVYVHCREVGLYDLLGSLPDQMIL